MVLLERLSATYALFISARETKNNNDLVGSAVDRNRRQRPNTYRYLLVVLCVMLCFVAVPNNLIIEISESFIRARLGLGTVHLSGKHIIWAIKDL